MALLGEWPAGLGISISKFTVKESLILAEDFGRPTISRLARLKLIVFAASLQSLGVWDELRNFLVTAA